MDTLIDQREGQFVVRLWDMFDGWIDVKGPCAYSEALKFWNEKTNNGTSNTCYGDGDYWKIFPADTEMFFTPERMGR